MTSNKVQQIQSIKGPKLTPSFWGSSYWNWKSYISTANNPWSLPKKKKLQKFRQKEKDETESFTKTVSCSCYKYDCLIIDPFQASLPCRTDRSTSWLVDCNVHYVSFMTLIWWFVKRQSSFSHLYSSLNIMVLHRRK